MLVGGACGARDPTTEDTKVAMRPTVMVMGPKKAVGMSVCTPELVAQGRLLVNTLTTLRTLLTLVMVLATRPWQGMVRGQMVVLGDIRDMCHLPRLPQGFPLSRYPGLPHHSSQGRVVSL